MITIIKAAPRMDARTATRIFTGKGGATPASFVLLFVALGIADVVDAAVDVVEVDEAVLEAWVDVDEWLGVTRGC